ncbi:hypothetical protein GQ473_01045 [archaeon]|nr:hypothetical protein [archaeon]
MISNKLITDSWNRNYDRIARKNRKIKNANVFIGFNANIDSVIYVDNSFEKILVENGITKLPDNYTAPQKIETKKEFLEVLLYSVTMSKEMELITSNKKLENWIENTFNINENRIGGQAGIMSKFLDSIGCRVVFSTPKLSDKMANLMPKDILIPTKEGIVRLNKATKSEDTKANYIFEYKSGLSILNKQTKHSDRFILATRPKGIEPRFHESTTIKFLSFFERIDRAIISGFHAIKAENKQEFEKSHIQIEKIKKANPDLKLHVEDAYIIDSRVSEELLNIIVTHIHSLGLNEVELENTLLFMHKNKLSNAIKKSNYSLFECYIGALSLYKKMKLERINMHTYNYCLIILSKNYGTGPEKMRDGLLFSILCASAKASYGVVSSIEDIKKVKTNLNMAGIKDIKRIHKELGICDGFLETGICDMGDHFLIAVPTKISNTLKSTVGLGDVVSSSAFVYDIL